MARGRTFEWRGADGSSLPFNREDGYWVLEGVTGLSKPIYAFDSESSADSPGKTFYDARAAARQVFIPMDVSAPDRATLLARKTILNSALDPVNKGPGYLYVTDANGTYRLNCYYSEGMEGDENGGVVGENNEVHWQRIGIVLEATDPYWESPSDVYFNWGYSGNTPFFPILPLRLNPSQIISDTTQPVTNNHLRNPSAETNVTFWDTQWAGGAPVVVLSQDASLVPPGGGSFAVKSISPNSVPQSGPSQITGTTMVIGVQYTAHCWVYVPSGQPDVRLLVNTATAESAPITAKDQWVWASVTFTATATSNRLTALPSPSSADGSNFLIYTDKWAISEGAISAASEYIDGDQDNCHWNGTAHASTSYRDAMYKPFVISNPGTVEAYPIWTIVGPGTQVDLYDIGRDRRLTLNYTIGSGQVVIIDTAKATVRLADGTNLYRYLSNDDFWPLAPGNTSITASLVGAASGSSLTVRFKPRLEALV